MTIQDIEKIVIELMELTRESVGLDVGKIRIDLISQCQIKLKNALRQFEIECFDAGFNRGLEEQR